MSDIWDDADEGRDAESVDGQDLLTDDVRGRREDGFFTKPRTSAPPSETVHWSAGGRD